MNSSRYIFLFLCFLSSVDVIGQVMSPFTPLIEAYSRRQQLTGHITDSYSFMLRPFVMSKELATDSLFNQVTGRNVPEEKLKVIPLPVVARLQHNTQYPFGPNNGVMIPNRGLQTVFSGGFLLSYGKFSFQFQPEVLVAENRDFRGMPFEQGRNWRDYYEYLNRIDLPERFGEGGVVRPNLGNSSMRITLDNGLSFGISNEYLWWGPSKRNSLMMGTNAPGFLHLSANTQKPLKTKIGSFEGQLLMGRLGNSGFSPPNPTLTYQATPLYVAKRDNDWRYLAGVLVSYRPEWVPGLSLGYSSTSQMYHNDMNTFGDFLPLFNGRKRYAGLDDPVIERRQQQSAGFFRWLNTEGKVEVYGEYGTFGNSKTLREFFVNPDLYRAFTLGFSKMISLRQPRQYLQVSAEITQTGQTVRKAIIEVDSWYTHSHVRHGYTHRGKNLGYGYGPGSNSVFVEISWVNEFDRIGLQLERIANNNDSFYLQFEHINGWDRYWVDIVPSLIADKRFGQFFLSTRFQLVNTLNYYWVLERDPNAALYRLQPGDDRTNFVTHVNIGYFF
nr:hypothetical protein [Cytophagales bacterium]